MEGGIDLEIIGGKTIQQLLEQDYSGCVQIVRDAYLAHDAGQTVNPQSVFLRFPDRPSARIIALPAHLMDEPAISGIKWVASYPENIKHGLKRASAVLVLNDANYGYPLACLEGSVISASRTAASAVLAAQSIRSAKSFDALGIVGTGEIARYVVRFFRQTGWKIHGVHLHDRDAAATTRFREWLGNCYPDMDVAELRSAEAVLSRSDVTLFTTSAIKPHVQDMELSCDKTVLHLSLRDLPPELIVRCNNVVDDVHHALTANTSLALAAENVDQANFVTGTLVDLLLARRQLDRRKPTVFSPFGLGMLDLAVGRWIFERARAAGMATTITNFFPK